MATLRIGLCSDVHGNLTALRAVAAAFAAQGPLDQVVVAGDHLWGGPRPREVWAMLRASGWALLRGNEDETLTVEEGDLPAELGGGPYGASYRAIHAWTRSALDGAILAELAALPLEYRLATPAGDLLVVHASPRALDDRRGGPHNTAAEMAAAYGGTGASAIAFGHYHRHFVRPTPFALLINVASVGLPIDGRPLAGYTILTATADGWIVEQRQAPYDPAEETAVAAAAGLPPWRPVEGSGAVGQGPGR